MVVIPARKQVKKNNKQAHVSTGRVKRHPPFHENPGHAGYTPGSLRPLGRRASSKTGIFFSGFSRKKFDAAQGNRRGIGRMALLVPKQVLTKLFVDELVWWGFEMGGQKITLMLSRH